MSTPTPMNEMIRVRLPERSTRTSLSTTAASKAAPTNQGSRAERVDASHMVTSEIAVQSNVMPVCTASESSQASK
jgi:hypothetical protein